MAAYGVTTEIKGVPQLVRELRNFSDHQLQNELRKVTREAVRDTIVPEVRKRTPVDTGRLKATVKADATARTAKLKVANRRTAYVYPLKAGFKPGGFASGAPRTEPRPFISEGIRAGYGAFIAAYVEALDKVVAEFNRRYSRKGVGRGR